MGLPLFLLERIKPMFLSIFASGDMDMMQGGFGGMGGDSTKSEVVSYEMEFMEMSFRGGEMVEVRGCLATAL